MIVVDVNLLLYAVISGFPQHAKAHAWWEQTLNGPTEVGLSSPAIFGFLRISTNPRVLTAPLAVDQAIGYVREWLALPNASFLSPGPRHLDIAFGLLTELGTGANFTTDVQLAALAIEHGAEMYSNDTDFGRFPDLRWINPLR
ncbi:MAG TPA: type II toxin-antitoxin system VapC family toxin [Micromonosporaceae bacterium]|nr:type II toxin-antitoxin system VapC family toxin [Micromonosporaceae bacterium]